MAAPDCNEEPSSYKSERKQSSGDLHSRLKIRKLLGVGETHDGDVHRSKLSQILGHSDQLYLKVPAGTKLWQLITAVTFTCFGIIAILRPLSMFPSLASCDGQLLPARLYGGCLLILSYALWLAWKSHDHEVIRFSLGGTGMYFTMQLIISSSSQPISALLGGVWPIAWLLMRVTSAAISISLYCMCCSRRQKPAANHNGADAAGISSKDTQ